MSGGILTGRSDTSQQDDSSEAAGENWAPLPPLAASPIPRPPPPRGPDRMGALRRMMLLWGVNSKSCQM